MNPADTEPVLAGRDLRIVFPPRGKHGPAHAVDGVNLTLGRGEIVALVGESGCGKSTVARTLVGLTRPTSGEIHYGGEPLDYSTAALKAHRRQVQLILQDPGGALNPRQNVYDAVAEGPRLHRMKSGLNERVHSALHRAGLRPPERFIARYPHELSGGQQQRVVIAGALALQPSVLVADEPVSSLDASVRGAILRLLLDLREQLSLSALVVSHDLGLAWSIADRVAVMYLGRIVEVGPVTEVLQRPRHPYTKALLSVLPDGERGRRRAPLAGDPPDPTVIPRGCRFHPRCPLLASLAEGDERAAYCRERPVMPLRATPEAAGESLVSCHLTAGEEYDSTGRTGEHVAPARAER